MRCALLIATLLVGSALASESGTTREATVAEADAIYLHILGSTPAAEAMDMLTDVGIETDRARRLLTFLDERLDEERQQNLSDTVGLCRNLDGRFSHPRALARELTRQQAAEREFEAALVERAKEILGVPSLVSVRSPHMNGNGMLTDTDVVQRVLDGELKPADAIARACGVTARDRASIIDRSESL